MYKHLLGEITLSVVCAYSCYLVADSLFGTSGVLAVVTLGVLRAAVLQQQCHTCRYLMLCCYCLLSDGMPMLTT